MDTDINHTKVNKFLLAFFVVLAIPACVVAQHRLTITVHALADQQAVTGASIQLVGVSTRQTNNAGSVIFDNVASGTYKVLVSHLGFEPFQQEIELKKDEEIYVNLRQRQYITDEVIINATRASDKTATTYRNIGKEELSKNNLGQDLPFLLDQTPGVVVNSDAGAGIGYTGLSIRGSDATRVNVTINGIPYNDSESMATVWVNMGDFASSINNIQIQRGVGTSTNGSGAFGASINIQTNERNDTAYAALDNSIGSFNTMKNTVRLGTGLINDQFSVDARLSRIVSDGFIDRASTDLKSFYLSGAWYGKRSTLRANVFSGKERTYQAWNGIPEEKIFGTADDVEGYIAANGLAGRDAENIRLSDPRRYNSFLYQNQHDNYQQDHYQLHYSTNIADKLMLSGALHYTRGRGYYEEYRPNDRYSAYGLSNPIISGDTLSRTDLVRERWLDNHFYGLTYAAEYRVNPDLNLTLGGAYNEYVGDHFGDVIWSRNPLTAEREAYDFATDLSFDTKHRYYLNDAKKTDFNIFAKAEWALGNFNLFGDLQYRKVGYRQDGLDRNRRDLDLDVDMDFFNPKVGLSYQLAQQSQAYVSYAVGNKEPIRRDFEDSGEDSRPLPERMQNIELGYRLRRSTLNLGVNGYAMLYKDQLIVTGMINDVGAANRVNVPDSYRLGVELDGRWQPIQQFSWALTAAFSRNRIKNFYEYISIYDEAWNDTGTQQENYYESTHIAMSPSFVGSSELAYRPIPKGEIALLSKYVSRQYLDNTTNVNRSLDAFFVNNLRLSYQLTLPRVKQVGLSLLINNLFNEDYEPNGYTYSSIVGTSLLTSNFYFPQAGTNFLLGLNVTF